MTSARKTGAGLSRKLPTRLFSSTTIIPSSLSFKASNILHRRSAHCQFIDGLFVYNRVCHALSRFTANVKLDIGRFLGPGCPFWRNILEEVLLRPFLLTDTDIHVCTVGFVASILGITSTSLPKPSTWRDDDEGGWTCNGKVVLTVHPGESFSPVFCSTVAYGFRQDVLTVWWELNHEGDLWRKLSRGSSGFRARELCVLLPFCCIRLIVSRQMVSKSFSPLHASTVYGTLLRPTMIYEAPSCMPTSPSHPKGCIINVHTQFTSKFIARCSPSLVYMPIISWLKCFAMRVLCMTVVAVYGHDSRRRT